MKDLLWLTVLKLYINSQLGHCVWPYGGQFMTAKTHGGSNSSLHGTRRGKGDRPGPGTSFPRMHPTTQLSHTKHCLLKVLPPTTGAAGLDQDFTMQNLEDTWSSKQGSSLLFCLDYEQFQAEPSLLQIYFIHQSTDYLKSGAEHELFYIPHSNNYSRWMALNEHLLFGCRLWWRKCAKTFPWSHSGCYKKLS